MVTAPSALTLKEGVDVEVQEEEVEVEEEGQQWCTLQHSLMMCVQHWHNVCKQRRRSNHVAAEMAATTALLLALEGQGVDASSNSVCRVVVEL